jgi:hypothetical protein
MKLSIIKSAFFLTLLSAGLASCLKDKDYDDQKIQSTRSESQPRIIEMRIAANSAAGFVSLAYDDSPNDTTVDLIPVHLNTTGGAPEDINVTVELRPNLVTEYNDDHETELNVPTSAQIAVINPGGVVTIPKGSNTGYLKVKFNPASIIGGDWALGFAITSVDKPGYTISGNLSTGVAQLLIKNQYDGVYEVTGTLVDLINPDFSSVAGDPYPFEVELRTVGATSNAMYVPGLDFGHLIKGGYYGSFSPVFNFDPATGKITSIVNYFGQPAGNGRSAQMDPTGLNKVNADKSIDAKYFMYQNGALRTTFDDHLKYIGPR